MPTQKISFDANDEVQQSIELVKAYYRDEHSIDLTTKQVICKVLEDWKEPNG